MFKIWCRVSGGVTGTREAWLKKDGVIVRYATREEAEREAALLNQTTGIHSSATFRYAVIEEGQE